MYCINLIFELYSVSIVSMHQIFSTYKRQRTKRSHFETPVLLNPKQKNPFVTKVKKNVDTYLSIFPLFEAYCNSIPSLKQFLSLDLKISLVKVHEEFLPPFLGIFERNKPGTTLSLRA